VFADYDEALTRLASLMAQSKGATEEKTSILSVLEGLEEFLTEEEQDFVAYLSADLYQIEGDEIRLPSELDEKESARRLAEAFASKDWVSVLALLRRVPPNVPEATRAYLRYRAYGEMNPKLPHAAAAFLDYASRTETRVNSYKAIWLQDMTHIDRPSALEESRRLVWESNSVDSRSLIMAASIVQQDLAARDRRGELRRDFEGLLGIVLKTLASGPLPLDIASMALLVATNSLIGLNRIEPLIDALTSSLNRALEQDRKEALGMQLMPLMRELHAHLVDAYRRLGHQERWESYDLELLVRNDVDNLANADLYAAYA